eukprot:424158-Hanusia_phi.AAC.1
MTTLAVRKRHAGSLRGEVMVGGVGGGRGYEQGCPLQEQRKRSGESKFKEAGRGQSKRGVFEYLPARCNLATSAGVTLATTPTPFSIYRSPPLSHPTPLLLSPNVLSQPENSSGSVLRRGSFHHKPVFQGWVVDKSQAKGTGRSWSREVATPRMRPSCNDPFWPLDRRPRRSGVVKVAEGREQSPVRRSDPITETLTAKSPGPT